MGLLKSNKTIKATIDRKIPKDRGRGSATKVQAAQAKQRQKEIKEDKKRKAREARIIKRAKLLRGAPNAGKEKKFREKALKRAAKREAKRKAR